jgi:hypothetical protein
MQISIVLKDEEEERLWGGDQAVSWERPTQRGGAGGRPPSSSGPGISELLKEEEQLANIPRKSRLIQEQEEMEERAHWAAHYGGQDRMGRPMGGGPMGGPTGGPLGGPQYYGGGGPMDYPPDQRGFFHGGGRENFMGHGGDFGQQYGGGFAPGFRGGSGGGSFNNQAEDFGWNPTAVKDYSAGTAGSGSVLRYRFFSVLGTDPNPRIRTSDERIRMRVRDAQKYHGFSYYFCLMMEGSGAGEGL